MICGHKEGNQICDNTEKHVNSHHMVMDTGGQAFPIVKGPGDQWTNGMTKRDEFALAALKGILSGRAGAYIDYDPGTVAKDCYRFADAMIIERDREPVKLARA